MSIAHGCHLLQDASSDIGLHFCILKFLQEPTEIHLGGIGTVDYVGKDNDDDY